MPNRQRRKKMRLLTKSVMFSPEQIEKIEGLVQLSKEIMLYHSFSCIVRLAIENGGLDQAEKYLKGIKRPKIVEILKESGKHPFVDKEGNPK